MLYLIYGGKSSPSLDRWGACPGVALMTPTEKGLRLVHDKLKGKILNVCFGGGVDSTAMLVLLKRAGIRPDLITFADTGVEKPDTYHHVRRMDAVLQSWGFPTVTWCRKVTTDRVGYTDLEGNCADNETLPSLAFGMKSCSIKWKQAPQDYALKGLQVWPEQVRPPSPPISGPRPRARRSPS